LLAYELLEFSDSNLVAILACVVGLEERVELLEDDGLPVGEKLRREIVLATEFGLADVATDQL
jgi:hypothetical protein